MFVRLSERLQSAVRNLRGRGKISPTDVKDAMRGVRIALLEADVHFSVVKDFITKVTERAVGQEVLRGLDAGQQVIEVVHDELAALMGGELAALGATAQKPRKILLLGLQGAGKTTTAGKLVHYLQQKEQRKPCLVAADVHRPAAVQQLTVLAQQAEVPIVCPLDSQEDAVTVARRGCAEAISQGCDDVVVDTAGRTHIDEAMMEELIELAAAVEPDEVLLVVDAMTGQDAVQVAKRFHSSVSLTGVILTKLDGDARGGAALSVRAVTGCPIKFVGLGEKMGALEPFHPNRMASRILGMGDVLTLIERARATVDEEEARAVEERLRKQTFTLEDLLAQLEKFQQMGPMEDLLTMLPGMSAMKGMKLDGGDQQLERVKAIVRSMTPNERSKPEIINASRRRRIAAGSGTTVAEINQLLKMFAGLRSFLRVAGKEAGKGGKRGFKLPFGSPFKGNFRRR